MKQTKQTLLAVDARGEPYTILVGNDPATGAATFETATGRKVRKLAKGRYLIARREGEWNDTEVSCDDPAAP